MSTTAERLANARARVESARIAYERAEGSATARTFGGSTDPAVLSGIRRKPNARADAARWGSYMRAADALLVLRRAERNVETLARQLDREQRDDEARAALTPERIKAATHVRDNWGWHVVIRVNPKTVTVVDRLWTERIDRARVIDVRP